MWDGGNLAFFLFIVCSSSSLATGLGGLGGLGGLVKHTLTHLLTDPWANYGLASNRHRHIPHLTSPHLTSCFARRYGMVWYRYGMGERCGMGNRPTHTLVCECVRGER